MHQYEAANKSCFSTNGLGLENCSCSFKCADVLSVLDGVVGVAGAVGVVAGVVGKAMEVARSIIVAASILGASSCRGCEGMLATAGLEGDRIGDSSEGEQGEDGDAMEDELALSELGEEQSVSCLETLRFTLALLFWNQICTRLEDIPNCSASCTLVCWLGILSV